jgi:hypothetical protein
MGYGCFLPYLRAGNRKESHLPRDELRRGRIIPDIEAGQINPSFIITHRMAHAHFRAFHPADRAFACERKRWNEGRQDLFAR